MWNVLEYHRKFLKSYNAIMKKSPTDIRRKILFRKDLLPKDESVSVFNENVKEPAFDYLKLKKCVSPSSIKNIFIQLLERHYNLRNKKYCQRSPIKTVSHGSEISSNPSPNN